MKKNMISLSGIKSACFMLLACLTLSICMTSCSSDEFETNLPEGPRQYTKAELIEQALSRMPQTRAGATKGVIMVTTKKEVSFRVLAVEDMMIYWDDKDSTKITGGIESSCEYIFTEEQELPYLIWIKGDKEAIKKLGVADNDLIYLNVRNNTGLEFLDCGKNRLDTLRLTGCSNLKTIQASECELSLIDVTQSPLLEELFLEINHLRSLDVGQNPNLQSLRVEYNWLTGIDVSKNLKLRTLEVGGNNITDLDLLKNRGLRRISIESLYLNTFNNSPVISTSFAYFSNLEELNVSYTNFTSLDLSNNPFVYGINIDGTEITQLDISGLSIEYLYASFSSLTNLVYTETNLRNSYDLRIDATPFENRMGAFYDFISDIPDRTGQSEGQLWTYSPYIEGLGTTIIEDKNWKVYQ